MSSIICMPSIKNCCQKKNINKLRKKRYIHPYYANALINKNKIHYFLDTIFYTQNTSQFSELNVWKLDTHFNIYKVVCMITVIMITITTIMIMIVIIIIIVRLLVGRNIHIIHKYSAIKMNRKNFLNRKWRKIAFG